ncbi:MAG: GH3 auxin-responsive promoter family protein [Planctomycetota bacterium]|nr:GH3 auxin-responsive promoter family protein [Planctomycetota bacterium]
MGLIARAFSYLSARRWARFDRDSADPEAAQRRQLRHLLARASPTRWGRQMRLDEIATVEQFRQRNKLLPVTDEAIRSNLRAGAILAACLARRGKAGNLVGGKFLYLGGSITLREKGPCLFGDASGIVARHIPFYARSRRLPDQAIAALTNWEQKIDRLVQDYLTADIRVMGACPSWAALLFKQMRHAADTRGLPSGRTGELWPRLSHFVSYGMAFEPYRGAFDEYVGRPLHYVDTYSSSETGMTAIQDEPGGPLRMIVDNGVFYEFVPADRAGEDNPPRLHVGEVETGRDYALVVSTNGGLWAYPLGDVVRFVSLRPPRIVFVGRTQVSLSAFGEHVTLAMIESAVAAACRTCNALVADYTIAPRYPSPAQPRPAHRWLMEFDRPPADPAAFMAVIDAAIRAENEDYDTHRTDDYGLEPPILIPLAPGTFYAWMKQKGKLGGQHKVPRVARTAQTPDELLALSGGLAR